MHDQTIRKKQLLYYDDLWLKSGREERESRHDIGWSYEKRRIDSAILGLISELLEIYYPNKPAIRILEIGIGKGDLALKIERRVLTTRIRYVGIDISKEGVKIACSKKANPDFQFLVGDGLHLPFKLETFNIVICSEVIEHVPEKEELLHQIFTVLERGGLLILTTPNPDAIVYFIPKMLRKISNRYRLGSPQPLNELINSHQVRVLLQKAGFKTIAQWGCVLSFYTVNLLEGTLKIPLNPLRRMFERFEKRFSSINLYQFILARKM